MKKKVLFKKFKIDQSQLLYKELHLYLKITKGIHFNLLIQNHVLIKSHQMKQMKFQDFYRHPVQAISQHQVMKKVIHQNQILNQK